MKSPHQMRCFLLSPGLQFLSIPLVFYFAFSQTEYTCRLFSENTELNYCFQNLECLSEEILFNVGVAILENRIAEIVKVQMVPPCLLLFLHVFIHQNHVVAII